jgi:adenylate cyclase
MRSSLLLLVIVSFFYSVTINCEVTASPPEDSIFELARNNPENLNLLEAFAAHVLSNPEWTDDEGRFYADELLRLSTSKNYAYGQSVALNHQGYLLEQTNQNQSLEKYKKALEIASRENFDKLKGTIFNNLSIVYALTGEYYLSVQFLLQLLSLAEETNDTLRIAVALNNIGLRYLDMDNPETSINFFKRAMLLNTAVGNEKRFATNLSNLALAYQIKGSTDSAYQYHREALKLHSRENDYYKMQFGYQALSVLYSDMGQLTKAWTAFDSAFLLAELTNDQYSVTNLKVVKADLLNRENRFNEAIAELKEAETKSLEMNFRPVLLDLYKEMVVSYRRLNLFEKAFQYNEKYLALRDSLQNIETKKARARLMEYEMEKSEREKEFLSRNIELQNLTIKRQKLLRNFIIIIILFVFVLLVLLWQRFKFIRRTGLELKEKNELIETEKQRSDILLQNILPAEIAAELKIHGSAKVKHYEMVTVMFIDFKGFTRMAEVMTPEQLVGQLDYCFKTYDNITDLHQIEKIKTIGDAYMCAGGLPIADDTNPIKIVEAACDIKKFMDEYKQARIAANLPYFEARIGIHTGPVIAGIVGHRKFAYDIWGDTVNIAARMETGGETGKINISQTTYEKVKDRFKCTYRGKLETKNKGFLDMFYVDCRL